MSDRDRSKDKNGGKKKSGRGWALRVFVLAVVLSALLSFFSTTALEGTGYVVAALVLAVGGFLLANRAFRRLKELQ